MGGKNVEQQMKDILEFEKQLATVSKLYFEKDPLEVFASRFEPPTNNIDLLQRSRRYRNDIYAANDIHYHNHNDDQKITVPQDQRRDDERMYHKFTLKELTKRSNFLNWTKYFDDAFDYHSRTSISFSSEIRPKNNSQNINYYEQLKSVAANANDTSYIINGPTSDQQQQQTGGDSAANGGRQPSTISKHRITEDESIIIYSPEYFDDLAKLIKNYTATEKGKVTLANYMAWSVIQSLIATLPKNFRDASKILRKALIGSEGIEVSWRYCVTDTNQVMGFALGSLFVRRVFHGNSKERAEEMIFSIRNAFKDNLPNLVWMDDRTRQLAKEKADHINQMIGFPDFILNPEKLNDKYEGVSGPELYIFSPDRYDDDLNFSFSSNALAFIDNRLSGCHVCAAGSSLDTDDHCIITDESLLS